MIKFILIIMVALGAAACSSETCYKCEGGKDIDAETKATQEFCNKDADKAAVDAAFWETTQKLGGQANAKCTKK